MKKAIFPPLRFKFQHWVVAINLLLVLLLTTAFLVLVFGKFRHLAETNAEENFALLADKAFYQMNEELQAQRSFVEIMAAADVGLAGQRGDIDAETLLPLLTRSLHAQRSRYSLYFGLPNDDFIQVVSVRGDTRINASLQAPAGTYDAVRIIRRRSGGERVEQWRFRAADGRLLGERQAAATYQPTTRAWYQGAQARQSAFLTEPYHFASNGELGVTFSAPLRDGRGAFGADVSLAAINTVVNRLQLSAHGAIAVLDPRRNILALKADAGFYGALSGTTPPTTPSATPPPATQQPMQTLGDHSGPYLASLARMDAAGQTPTSGQVQLAGRPFVLAARNLEPLPGQRYRILALAPLSDFTAVVDRSLREVLLLAGVLMLVLIPVALFSTRQVAASLVALARHADRLRQLDFSTRPVRVDSFLKEVNALGHVQEVMHASIAQRTLALEDARRKLAHLVQIGIMLGREPDRDQLLRNMLFGARDIAHCAAATLHVGDAAGGWRMLLSTATATVAAADAATDASAPALAPAQPPDALLHLALQRRQPVVVDDLRAESAVPRDALERLQAQLGLDLRSALAVPLLARDGEVIGVVQLFNALDAQTQQPIPFDAEVVEYISALSSQAAIALENQNLVQSQREVMESIIQMLASAIDAKSAYTGGHCARVPELAVMLAEEAGKVQSGSLADFGFSTEEEWREFRIGAWLHDCGKVITPEYVVDKATKLETIYNRIHEVRTRFEVLLRDAEIAALRQVAAGQDAASAWAAFAQRQQQLREDFAFVAEANLGGETMAPADVQRLHALGAQPWLRHFDNRLGLAQDEARRYAGTASPTLPVEEPLLADQPHHIVPREGERAHDAAHGFRVKVPQHLYNHGELHNLGVGRGTLTEEERYKINEHIMHTIVMLERMPFPKNLRRVAEYAGTHHETLAGTGYPRKLGAEQLSVPARIMAIADIFEALTASDRPYKKAKPLSEAVAILHRFKLDRHIDPELFDLFLRTGIHQRYAERFLQPEQIDSVDIHDFVATTDA